MIYERNRGVCWASGFVAVPVMTLSILIGVLLLAGWAFVMIKVRS